MSSRVGDTKQERNSCVMSNLSSDAICLQPIRDPYEPGYSITQWHYHRKKQNETLSSTFFFFIRKLFSNNWKFTAQQVYNRSSRQTTTGVFVDISMKIYRLNTHRLYKFTINNSNFNADQLFSTTFYFNWIENWNVDMENVYWIKKTKIHFFSSNGKRCKYVRRWPEKLFIQICCMD